MCAFGLKNIVLTKKADKVAGRAKKFRREIDKMMSNESSQCVCIQVNN